MRNKITLEIHKIEIPKELSQRSLMGVNQVKAKGLFILFFIYLTCLDSYLYYLVYINFINSSNHFINFFYILLYLLGLIPLTVFLAERLAVFALNKGLGRSKKINILIAVMILLPILLFSLYRYNDYSEKKLDEVISMNTNNMDYVIINDEWISDNKEHIEALTVFLSQYDVKKMEDHEWDSDVSNERGIRITIYSKGNPVGASIYENRLLYYNSGDYYQVINGPIDMNWVEKMYKEWKKIESTTIP